MMTEPAQFKMIPEQGELIAIRRELRFYPSVNRHPARLTPDQSAAFNRDGYLSGIRVFSEDEIAEHRRYFDVILARVLAEGGSSYSISTAHLKYARVYDLLTHPRIVACVKDLLGENVIGWGSHYFCKLPRDGKAVTLGQGMVLRGSVGWSFFPGDYASNGLLKNAPFTAAFTCGSSTTGSLTNTGCPAGIGTLSQGPPRPVEPSAFPTANGSLDLARIIPSSFTAMDLDFKASYNIQFNLTLEKQFGNSVATISP